MKAIKTYKNTIDKLIDDEIWKSDKNDNLDMERAKTLWKSQNDKFVNIAKDARETIKQLKDKTMKTTNELTKYRPYSIGRYTKEGYADIIFESDGLMTVPKNSAQSIVDLLNQAFNNGVKMTLKSTSIQTGSITPPSEPMIKSKPMPQEEPHPLNTYKRSR